MAGAWKKVSDIWQYKHTEGDHMNASKNTIHQKLRVPEAGKNIYEEVGPEEVKEDKNHIVIYHGEKNFVDSDVPQLAKRASQWDSVTRLVPGFTEDMLLIVDLMYKSEYFLTKRLNANLEEEGLCPVDHVMQALNRLKNKFITKKENKALRRALRRFFKSIGGNIPEDVLIAQWTTCRDWKCRRVSFAHPLELASLENVKNKISSDEGFAEVREIALIMVNSIENAH